MKWWPTRCLTYLDTAARLSHLPSFFHGLNLVHSLCVLCHLYACFFALVADHTQLPVRFSQVKLLHKFIQTVTRAPRTKPPSRSSLCHITSILYVSQWASQDSEEDHCSVDDKMSSLIKQLCLTSQPGSLPRIIHHHHQITMCEKCHLFRPNTVCPCSCAIWCQRLSDRISQLSDGRVNWIYNPVLPDNANLNKTWLKNSSKTSHYVWFGLECHTLHSKRFIVTPLRFVLTQDTMGKILWLLM